MNLPAFLALIPAGEYLFLLPICAAIATVNAASHREDMRSIRRHAVRSSFMLFLGILLFKVAISLFFELVLPG